MQKTIGTVKIRAVRDLRGAWVAEVAKTGQRLPQQYRTKPALFADLERVCWTIGVDRFERDCLRT